MYMKISDDVYLFVRVDILDIFFDLAVYIFCILVSLFTLNKDT